VADLLAGEDLAEDALPRRVTGIGWCRTMTCWTPGSPAPCGPTAPFGWPDPARRLEGFTGAFLSTNVLVTSRDIITLWVARMVMTALYNVGKIPFHHVYIHPKISTGAAKR
jgi:valyl-tRNA synthetase